MGMTKYFLLTSPGANFIDYDLNYDSVSLNGEQVLFVGTTLVDAVFLRPGVTIDFTSTLASADKVYLTGNLADYSKSISGATMTLLRGSGTTQESVSFIKSQSQSASDVLVFADGTVSSFDLYSNLTASTALPAPNIAETSRAPFALAASAPALSASVRAFALNATGDTFASMKPGMSLEVYGSPGIDNVYVADGTNVDATVLGASADNIYFRGNWSEYTKTVTGTVINFSRTVGGNAELVKVSAALGASNDRLYFADGSVLSNDAKIALAANINTIIGSVTGYDATKVTPGLAPTLGTSALDNVTNLDVGSNIVLNYGESVTAVSNKFIHIVNDGGMGFHVPSTNTSTYFHSLDILVTDTNQVSISGGKVTINPIADLDLASNYHISIDAGAFLGATSRVVTSAFNGTTALNFSTVTPGSTAVASAAQSQVMDATGALTNSYQWLDVEGLGAATTAKALDLSTGKIALVAADYDPAGPNESTGYDGVGVGDFNVSANNFGADDLIYIDNQSTVANDLTKTEIVDRGTSPTKLHFASGINSTGGFINVSLSGSTSSFGSIPAMKTLLGASRDPVYSDAFPVIDTTPPNVSAIAYGSNDGNLALGETLTLSVTLSEAVNVTGTPTIALANGGTASYTAGTGTSVLTFSYTPSAGQSTADLATATSTALAGTIKDLAGNAVVSSGFNNVNPNGTLAVDVVAPTLNSSTPATSSTAVAVGSNIVLNFAEAVQAGAGNIVISNGTGSGADTRTIAITDTSQVTISGTTVTVNPSLDLLAAGTYSVQMASGVIKDLAGNSYAGISNSSTLSFSTPLGPSSPNVIKVSNNYVEVAPSSSALVKLVPTATSAGLVFDVQLDSAVPQFDSMGIFFSFNAAKLVYNNSTTAIKGTWDIADQGLAIDAINTATLGAVSQVPLDFSQTHSLANVGFSWASGVSGPVNADGMHLNIFLSRGITPMQTVLDLSQDISFKAATANGGTATGTSGVDQFILGGGNVTVTGGAGADQFVLTTSQVSLTIQDFTSGVDKIDLGRLISSLGYTSVNTSASATPVAGQLIPWAAGSAVPTATQITSHDLALDNKAWSYYDSVTKHLDMYADRDTSVSHVDIVKLTVQFGSLSTGLAATDLLMIPYNTGPVI